MDIRISKINALIRLIEDPDPQVYDQVKNELILIGEPALYSLENASKNNDFGPEFKSRVFSVINIILK